MGGKHFDIVADFAPRFSFDGQHSHHHLHNTNMHPPNAFFQSITTDNCRGYYLKFQVEIPAGNDIVLYWF